MSGDSAFGSGGRPIPRYSAKKRHIFLPPSTVILEADDFSFVKECFRWKGTVLRNITPQLIAAVIMGFVGQYAKLFFCGPNVASSCLDSDSDDCKTPEDCPVTFDPTGHVVVALILSFLLVTRVELAQDRYFGGKKNFGAIYNGLRDMNIAFTVFLRAPRQDEVNFHGKEYTPSAMQELARDRVELLRLTNLLYAFIRQVVREQRHGYSDTGPVEDEEIITNDRAGKPCIASLWKDEAEFAEYKSTDPWNRPNIVMANIQAICEHHRRLGHLSEKGLMDIYTETEKVMGELKGIERIITTPIPHSYLHMLDFLLVFFVYTTPFVFSASFKYATSFPSFVIALAFYGVNELGRALEDPFGWKEPNHDLTQVGWRIYRENTIMHEAIGAMDHDDLSKGSDDEMRLAHLLVGEDVKRIQARRLEEESELGASKSREPGPEDEVDPKYIKPKEKVESSFQFLLVVFQVKGTVIPSIVTQLVLSQLVALFAFGSMMIVCDDPDSVDNCPVAVPDEAHSIMATVMGFLLVFRSNISYDRYYEGKMSLGKMYSGLRNLNVAFATFMRTELENEPGYNALYASDSFRQKLHEDRLEVLRLTNVLYAFVRHTLREHRVGLADGKVPTDAQILGEDVQGKPSVTAMFLEGEVDFWLNISPNNRPNVVMGKIQYIVEHHRRRGHISERAAFEIYLQCENVLEAWKATERIVSTPIPYSYLHMLNFVLFIFVYTCPFIFSFTFRGFLFIPSALVVLGFYGIAEVGRVMQDPFNYTEPFHNLTTVGWRMFKENLQIYEKVCAIVSKDDQLLHNCEMYKKLHSAMQVGRGVSTMAISAAQGVSKDHGKEAASREMGIGNYAFLTEVFKWKNTVHTKVVPQVVIAVAVALLGNITVWRLCAKSGNLLTMSAEDTLPENCDATQLFATPTAHRLVGNITGFLLVFRTYIADYRFYEGKKSLGALFNAIRNVNVAFCSFLRTDLEGEQAYVGDQAQVEVNTQLSKDHIELRRLSNLLFAFIRQAVREQRHGYPETEEVSDAELVHEDEAGNPSLKSLLTDQEKDEYANFNYKNRPNIVVTRMQAIVEHHRRMNHISERGAFDIYHELELCLQAFQDMERIVGTRMPYQYLHMVTFILFLYIYTAPLVFVGLFGRLAFFPSAILALGFYGVYEIGRSIEDPFTYTEPRHDLTAAGWRLYSETLQLHEVMHDMSGRPEFQGDADRRIVQSKGQSRSEYARVRDTSKSAAQRKQEGPRTLSDAGYGFITEAFKVKDTIHLKVIPQWVTGAAMGLVAQCAKLNVCGADVETAQDCAITFERYAHTTVGSVLAFLLVFRTNLAYDRYYEAKTAMSNIHNRLRNLNMGVSVFLRSPRKGEPDYEGGKAHTMKMVRLAQDRVELLRLTALLMGFIRQSLREQRLGYPSGRFASDHHLLQEDLYGKPSIGALLTKTEVEEYKKVTFNNRPNIVVALIQRIVEHNRRVGNICDRGAFDIYLESKSVLDELKSCERVVTTPVPFQYLQMMNFVLFFFVFSAPFVFSVDFKWMTWFPSGILAMAYYGIDAIGKAIEHPFDWEKPNLDLTSIGWRIYCENVQIQRQGLSPEEEEIPAVVRTLDELAVTTPRVTMPPSAPTTEAEKALLLSRRDMALREAMLSTQKEWPDGPWAWFTEVLLYRGTVFERVLPQIICAAGMGVVAQVTKVFWCGNNVKKESQCIITFGTNMHSIAVTIIGFLLVFRTNLSYKKYYDGMTNLGQMYTSMRNVNIALLAFMRQSYEGEPGYSKDGFMLRSVMVREDLQELRRQCNIAYAFIRQLVRDQRHGYPTGKVDDDELLRNDKHGAPSLSTLLTEPERELYRGIEPLNRPNIAFANMERIIERHRRLGHIYEQAAFEVYHEMEAVMQGLKGCEFIATTPAPYQYLQMVQFLLFVYVYSAPFVFTITFSWITPIPSMVVALGFYGINEIGVAIEDPFSWSPPYHDMSGVGTRIFNEVLAIHSLQRSSKTAAGQASEKKAAKGDEIPGTMTSG